MWRQWRLALLLAGIAGCGSAGDRADNQVERKVAEFTLTSDAFGDGQAIPSEYTCDGANRTPALGWSDPPPGTRSLALIVDDPDAPGGTFRHWGVYGIPPDARSIPETAFQAVNDFDKPGYGGPCPPKGGGPHRYRFKLLALDTATFDLASQKIGDVEAAAEKYVIGRAELMGTYERK